MRTDLRAIIATVLQEIKNVFLRKDLAEEVAQEAIDIIKKRTLTGKGINGKSTQKLKPLSKSYIEYRQGKAIFFQKNGKTIGAKGNFTPPKLSPKTTPKKSNLTLTGDMLNDLDYKISKSGQFRKIEIAIYEEFSKKKAQWVTEGGRPFFGITENEKQFLIRLLFSKIEKKVQKALNKYNGKTFQL